MKSKDCSVPSSSILLSSTSTSPLLNARRVKTDLQTSENIFLQSNALRSRSSSPILPPLRNFSIKHCENLAKAVNGNSKFICSKTVR